VGQRASQTAMESCRVLGSVGKHQWKQQHEQGQQDGDEYGRHRCLVVRTNRMPIRPLAAELRRWLHPRRISSAGRVGWDSHGWMPPQRRDLIRDQVAASRCCTPPARWGTGMWLARSGRRTPRAIALATLLAVARVLTSKPPRGLRPAMGLRLAATARSCAAVGASRALRRRGRRGAPDGGRAHPCAAGRSLRG
jgi:hypothetical protein